MRRSVLAAGAAAVLALPSAAAAQSAGDQQYQDPFPASGGSGGSSGSSGSSGSTQQTASSNSSSSGTGSDAGQLSAGPPPGSSSSTATGAQLPATGADVGLIAALGVGLLCTGLGLRLRMPERQRTPAAE